MSKASFRDIAWYILQWTNTLMCGKSYRIYWGNLGQILVLRFRYVFHIIVATQMTFFFTVYLQNEQPKEWIHLRDIKPLEIQCDNTSNW